MTTKLCFGSFDRGVLIASPFNASLGSLAVWPVFIPFRCGCFIPSQFTDRDCMSSNVISRPCRTWSFGCMSRIDCPHLRILCRPFDWLPESFVPSPSLVRGDLRGATCVRGDLRGVPGVRVVLPWDSSGSWSPPSLRRGDPPSVSSSSSSSSVSSSLDLGGDLQSFSYINAVNGGRAGATTNPLSSSSQRRSYRLLAFSRSCCSILHASDAFPITIIKELRWPLRLCISRCRLNSRRASCA